MAKRGRKPSQRKGYFYEEEEQAVIAYIKSDDEKERSRIYDEKLAKPIHKMVESIIRRYKLYIPDEEFEDTFNDTVSFLLSKADKFKPGKYKAYSYFGTICRNYLIGRIQSYTRTLKRNPSYDINDEDFLNNENLAEEDDYGAKVAKETVDRLIKRIDAMLLDPVKYSMKENEIKLGSALKNLLENWDYVLTTDGSNKLNKNTILFFLRDITGLDTKGIRDNMKKFKNEFIQIRQYIIS